MDFLIDNWLLLGIALGSASMLYLGYGKGRGLSVNEVVAAINKQKAVVIDVGDSEQSIHKARRVPLSELAATLPNLVKNKSTPIVLVCPRGLRAGGAQRIAKKLGYENTMVLQGGLKTWSEAGLPLVAIHHTKSAGNKAGGKAAKAPAKARLTKDKEQ